MLPSMSALKPAVEWASACPLAAGVSAADVTTSLVMGRGLKMLHGTMAERGAYSSAQGSWPSPISGLSHAKLHMLDGYLRSDFDDPSSRNLEVVGGVVRRAAQRDKQVILPLRHSGLRGGLQG